MMEPRITAKSQLIGRLCRVLGKDHVDMVHLDLVNALLGLDLIDYTTAAVVEAQLNHAREESEV